MSGGANFVVRSVGDISRAVGAVSAETKLRWWYRGHSSSGYHLIPSGKRGYTPKEEQYFYNEFYCRAGTRHVGCPDDDDVARWLALMQHYRLPTRLLDWSSSPLVAAYFAVETSGVGDACIWALAPSVLNQAQGFEPLLYPITAKTVRPLLEPAKKGTDTTDRVIAALAVEGDPRIQMQQAAFTVHASTVPLDQFADAPNWLRLMLIPEDAIVGIREELHLLGFRADYLFPDLEALAQELRALFPPVVTAGSSASATAGPTQP